MAVLLCSGQGAQKVGMGADLLSVPEVAEAFEQASDVLGVDVAALSREGSADDINAAFNAQALTVALSLGIGRTLQARGLAVSAIVGQSLGQITGLALSGSLSDKDMLALLDVRAHALEESCAAQAGGMMALLGVDEQTAQALCDECAHGDILVLANYNCPGQIVASGMIDAIDRLQEVAREKRIRCARLNTAGAFHSPLMQQASQKVKAFCETLTFADPEILLICNTDARAFVASEAAQRLGSQVVSPVLFNQSIQSLIEQGETCFIEAGFGGVLFGLVKRINKNVTRYKVGTREELEALCEALSLPADCAV